MHFSVDDNLEHISEDYLGTLSTMSLMQQRRFMEGEYADEGEGEVFKKINWGELPPASEFVDCIIYTDPSAKDREVNDYKASVLLGQARGKSGLSTCGRCKVLPARCWKTSMSFTEKRRLHPAY